MSRKETKSLCRICLREGATYPIFEETNSKNIQSKLTNCLREKIEDVEGYPRKICKTCNNTLEIVDSFIKKFQQTCKLLEERLPIPKKESYSDFSDNERSYETEEVEIEFKTIKQEPIDILESLDNTEHLKELLQPKPKHFPNSQKQEEGKLKKNKNKFGNISNKVASSILEGEFAWTEETWCLKSSKAKLPKENIQTQRRDTKPIQPKTKVVDSSKLCDLCGVIFENQDTLHRHREKVHFKKSYKCSYCTAVFAAKQSVQRHIKTAHLGHKDFICSYCGKIYTFKNSLITHVAKIHTKTATAKTYSCRFCSKTYKVAKSVQIHERSAHTGERPDECQVCFKTFFCRAYLTEHMRLHTGEAPFKCPICGRGYAQRGNMKSHISHNHRMSQLDEATLSKLKPSYLKLMKS